MPSIKTALVEPCPEVSKTITVAPKSDAFFAAKENHTCFKILSLTKFICYVYVIRIPSFRKRLHIRKLGPESQFQDFPNLEITSKLFGVQIVSRVSRIAHCAH